MAPVERRKYPRYDIHIKVAVVMPKAISFYATATDIAADGIGLLTTRVILPGTKIAIFMNLKDEIEIRGTVVWTLDAPQQGKIMYQTGVQMDIIVFPHKKGFELSDKAGLVQEILFQSEKN